MQKFKTVLLGSLLSLMLIGTAQSEEAPLKGLKLGFGFDRGFGVTGSMGKFNGFIGNDGLSVDYLFKRDALNVEVNAPVHWYVGAGGYGDWGDGDIGARLPVGLDVAFAKQFDAYAQIIPRLRVNNDARFGVDFAIGARYQF